MRQLSISAAWEETRAILAREGSLLSAVALALVALPTAMQRVCSTRVGWTRSTRPGGSTWSPLPASLIALAGQLALIRLALGPSITVGAAIAHGLRRMPIYFVVVLMLVAALVLIAIPIGLVLGAMGVPLQREADCR